MNAGGPPAQRPNAALAVAFARLGGYADALGLLGLGAAVTPH